MKKKIGFIHRDKFRRYVTSVTFRCRVVETTFLMRFALFGANDEARAVESDVWRVGAVANGGR